MATTLKTKTPCCQVSTEVVGMKHATDAVRRTCPKCRTTWSLVVKPLGPMLGGVAHEILWAVAQVRVGSGR